MVKKQKVAAQCRSRSRYTGGYAGAKGRRKTKRNCNTAKSTGGGCCRGNHQNHKVSYHRRIAGAGQAKLDARAELNAHQHAKFSGPNGPPARAQAKAVVKAAHTASWAKAEAKAALSAKKAEGRANSPPAPEGRVASTRNLPITPSPVQSVTARESDGKDEAKDEAPSVVFRATKPARLQNRFAAPRWANCDRCPGCPKC